MKKLFVVVSILMFVCAFSVLAEEPKATPKPAETSTGSGFSPAEPPHHGAMQPVDITRFTCVVQGSPVEFPDDIYIRNTGNTIVKKGTKVHWDVTNTPGKGDYTFAADLAPNTGLFVNSVLGPGLTAGLPCTVTVLSKPKMIAKPVATPVLTQLSLPCVVQGSPVEFPNDLYITNNRSTTIAKGKVIQWSMTNNPGIKGEYTLTEDLLPQKSMYMNEILGPGLSAGLKCTAKVK